MKKGAKTMIIGGILLVSAIAIPVAVMVPSLSSEGPLDEQFQVPGVGIYEVEEPGRYYLWHDYQNTFTGTDFKWPDIPSGAKISVKPGFKLLAHRVVGRDAVM